MQHYFAESVIVIIGISCVLAILLVSFCAIIMIHLSTTLTHTVLSILSLVLCFITICITGGALYLKTKKITIPLVEASNVIVEIAKGNFKVRIPNKFKKSKGYEYENEIDELIDNLNKMVSELKGMDYMRKDFMSNVFHEVKTPVTAITGFSEILLDGNLLEEEHQEIISAKDTIRVDEQIRKCIILLSEKWQSKQIEFILDLPSITVVLDKNLLMQVWMTLC